MKFESHHEVILDRIPGATAAAGDDVVADAYARAPKRTQRYARSIERGSVDATGRGYRTTVGATVSSARVKELGAFITPKRAQRLRFPIGGSWRTAMGVRIPAQPTVGPAAAKFPQYLTDRLRASTGGLVRVGRFGSTSRRADSRGGIVR